MKKREILLSGTILTLAVLACTFGQAEPPPATLESVSSPKGAPVEPTLSQPGPASLQPPLSGDVLMPENLEYLGAFRLPDANGGSNWEYSGQGLTYYPGGDSSGSEDGFPGSLFGFGYDHHMQVSEISIPEPVISRNLDDQ